MTLLVAFWQIASTVPAGAVTLYWDTDGSTTLNNVDGTNIGGTGTWNTSTPNWWNLGSLVNWPNTNVDHAVFAGTPGTVTVAPGIIVNRLTFQSGGYVFNGAPLTLAGTTPTLYSYAGTSTRINTELQGTAGLTKTGAGAVYLNGPNTYAGITTINNGTLVVGSSNALGSDSSTVTVAVGTISVPVPCRLGIQHGLHA